MGAVENIITDNLPIWSSSVQSKSSSGRGTSSKRTLYGVKKLRELILDLAVRGLLVPQDPNDEPASVLLMRLHGERDLLVTNKIIRKPKVLKDVSDTEFPSSIPTGWVRVRLNDIGDWGAGATPLRSRSEFYGGAISWFKSGELNADFISHSEETVTELALKESSLRLNKSGDVLLAMYGATIGKASILTLPATTNQAVCACTVFNGVGNVFLLTLLKAYRPRFLAIGVGGAQPNISREKIIDTPIALPPLAEQHRIVTKVDELMALCDTLEQQQEDSIQAHETLVETLLEALTDAVDADVFQAAWQRISEYFDVLFTTEHSIDKLKETILQLAVMGKLVPQDPSDEPASELLKNIVAKKEQLVKEKLIKKQKPLTEITDEEKPFNLPRGWVWTTLSNLGTFFGGKTPSKNNSRYWGGSIPWVTPKDMKVNDIFGAQDKVTQLAIDDGLGLVDCESLLFVARSGILRRAFPVAITRVECTVNQDLKVLSLFDKKLSRYVHLMMKGFEGYILNNLTKIGTTVESLKFDEFSRHYFLLPPLAEQHRIVAKVDQLMALCDQLKDSLQQAQQTQIHLTDAVVENAL